MHAEITINGTVYRLSADCQECRDQMEAWLFRVAVEQLAKAEKAGVITRPEAIAMKEATIKDYQIQRYSYGGDLHMNGLFSSAAIKQRMLIRLRIHHPDIHESIVSGWVETHGLNEANELMNVADGFAPKSPSQAAEQPSTGIS